MLESLSAKTIPHAQDRLRGTVTDVVPRSRGEVTGFQKPKELIAYLGLVPSEHSSGESVRRGHNTKTGNSHVRRVLVESAWTYKHHARITGHLINDSRSYPEISARFPGRRN